MSVMIERARTPSLGKQAIRPKGTGFLTGVAALVHAHRGRLLGYARRRGLDAEEALDAVQDTFITFLKLPEARATEDDPLQSLKLLTVILRHNVQNQRRKRVRQGQVQELLVNDDRAQEEPGSERLIAFVEELARVNGCMQRMASLQREVVMLSLLDEQPREHVAEVLGISAGYVRVLLHRAREHLRTCSDPADGQRAGVAGDRAFVSLGS